MLQKIFKPFFWLSLFLTGCGNREVSLPFYNTPDFSPQFIEDSVTHYLPSINAQNQDGVWLNTDSLKGKIHVANFMFTKCGSICPNMTENLKVAADKFKVNNNILFLSYSVTPWSDSVSQLNTYKQENANGLNNWHFLTGEKSHIYELARKGYFAEENIGFTKDSTEFLHTEHIILVDPELRIRGIYNGTLPLEINLLIEDIETLQQEGL